jgi:hypothetical protein
VLGCLSVTYHVHVVTFGLFLRLSRPQPVLQGPASKQKAPRPQAVAEITVVGQNPQMPCCVSTRQLNPSGAIYGCDGSPLRKPQVDSAVIPSLACTRRAVGRMAGRVMRATALAHLAVPRRPAVKATKCIY